MATRIRLKRFGRRNRPSFRVVIMDSRAKRDGAAIEELGWYNPVEKENNFSLKEDRIIHWLEQGAQPSDTVKNLMKKSGLLYRWHMIRQGLDEKTINREIQKWMFDRDAREREKSEMKVEAVSEEPEPAAPTEEPGEELPGKKEDEVEVVSEKPEPAAPTEEPGEELPGKKEDEVEVVSEKPEPTAASEETVAPIEKTEVEEQVKVEEVEKSEKEEEIDESGKSEDTKKRPKVKSKTTGEKSEKEIDQSKKTTKKSKSESKEKSD